MSRGCRSSLDNQNYLNDVLVFPSQVMVPEWIPHGKKKLVESLREIDRKLFSPEEREIVMASCESSLTAAEYPVELADETLLRDVQYRAVFFIRTEEIWTGFDESVGEGLEKRQPIWAEHHVNRGGGTGWSKIFLAYVPIRPVSHTTNRGIDLVPDEELFIICRNCENSCWKKSVESGPHCP